jgi:hypothetical protein
MDYDLQKSNEVCINENPSEDMYLWKNTLKLGKFFFKGIMKLWLNYGQ